MKSNRYSKIWVNLFATWGLSIGYGQDINGKWIELKDCEAYTHPSIHILEFNGSKSIQYDFDKKIDSAFYEIFGNTP